MYMYIAAVVSFQSSTLTSAVNWPTIDQYGLRLRGDNIVNIIYCLSLIRSISFRALLCLKYSPSVSSESDVISFVNIAKQVLLESLYGSYLVMHSKE